LRSRLGEHRSRWFARRRAYQGLAARGDYRGGHREGSTTRYSRLANIPKVLVHNRDYADDKIEAAPTTPGMKYRHYSPAVPVTLLLTRPSLSGVEPATGFSDYVHSLQKSSGYGKLMIGVLAATDSKLWKAMDSIKNISWLRYPLGPLAEPNVIAHNLFDGLLSLEKGGVELIFIEEIDEVREGLAVMNRVRKAASESIRIELDKYGSVYLCYNFFPSCSPPGWRSNCSIIILKM
jgi:hypothetical protein